MLWYDFIISLKQRKNKIQTKDKIQRQHTHNIIEKYMDLSTLFVVSHELSAN